MQILDKLLRQSQMFIQALRSTRASFVEGIELVQNAKLLYNGKSMAGCTSLKIIPQKTRDICWNLEKPVAFFREMSTTKRIIKHQFWGWGWLLAWTSSSSPWTRQNAPFGKLPWQWKTVTLDIATTSSNNLFFMNFSVLCQFTSVYPQKRVGLFKGNG